MKKYFWVSALSCSLFMSSFSYAQFDNLREGVQSFQQEKDAWRRKDNTKIQILQNIQDSLGRDALRNVINSEQVFCYQIDSKSSDFSGYTLNNFAVTGFCGIVNDELKNVLISQFFSNAGNFDFATSEKCVIRPKLMLRFARGVDFTDVLVSAPCYSISVYYAGKVKTFNFKPGAELLETMVTSFNEKSVDFVSPTLLNQMLPIGVPQTVEQQQIVRKNSQPIRNWVQPVARSIRQKTTSETSSKTSGWNNLKVNIK